MAALLEQLNVGVHLSKISLHFLAFCLYLNY